VLSQVTVETFGGAAASYPDGPRYVHYVNRVDMVPSGTGLGASKISLSSPGRGATVVRFNATGNAFKWGWPPVNPVAPHSFTVAQHPFTEVYLPRRRPLN